MNMKLFAVGILALLLSACEKPPNEWSNSTRNLSDVEGLQDCKMYKIHTGENELIVIRCPNSDTATSTKVGKTPRKYIIVEEGMENEQAAN